MSHLAILGASGHGKVVADTAILSFYWEKISFFDDAWTDLTNYLPWPILGDTQLLLNKLKEFSGVVVGIGDNVVRQEKYELLVSHNAPLATIVHPTAYISSHAQIGAGSVVFAQVAINIHANIGLGAIVNTGATIDHDCVLDDYVHISPGANLGGCVKVGRRSWTGIGSAVKQGITIGADVKTGAGSTIVQSVSDHQIVVGTPAKPLLMSNQN